MGSQKKPKWRCSETSSSQLLHDVVPGAQADLLAQAVGVGDLELEPRHDAEHPDGDLGGAQQVGLVLADLADLAASRSRAARRARRPRGSCSACPSRASRSTTAPAICWVSMSPWLRSASPALPQRLVEVADQRAGERRRALAPGVGGHDAAHRREVEQQAVGLDDRRERVRRRGDPHARRRGRPPRGRAPATSSSSRGAAAKAGVKDWLPTQFVHFVAAGRSVRVIWAMRADATARTTAARPRRSPPPPPRAPTTEHDSSVRCAWSASPGPQTIAGGVP